MLNYNYTKLPYCLTWLTAVPFGTSAEPQTNVKLKDYRREPLEWFSTMSQSRKMNCWSWLNSLCLSTEGFSKLRFSSLRQRRINFQVKYCVFRRLLFSLQVGRWKRKKQISQPKAILTFQKGSANNTSLCTIKSQLWAPELYNFSIGFSVGFIYAWGRGI